MPAQPHPPLRILTFGAGAIGTYIGGSLALQGHEVIFLERPHNIQGIHDRGLHLDIEGQIHTIDTPSVTDSLRKALESGPFDIMIFALKSYHTEKVLGDITPMVDQLPPLLCLENGVENELKLSRVLGENKVIPGTVTSAVERLEAGKIRLEKKRGVGISSRHPLSKRLAGACQQANLNAKLYSQPAAMKWSKMLTNLMANASSAILNMTPVEIFANHDLHRLEVRQFREALAVMRAQKIRPVRLPGIPVKLLAHGVRFLPPTISQPLLKKAVGEGRGEKMPSFHIDLHRGRELSEVDYLNGAVVRFGEKVGVPTPVNRILNETLLALTRGEMPLDAYDHQPDKLLGML